MILFPPKEIRTIIEIRKALGHGLNTWSLDEELKKKTKQKGGEIHPVLPISLDPKP